MYALSIHGAILTYRTFIFPLRIKGGKPIPLFPFLVAMFFCSVNGAVQTYGVLLRNSEIRHWCPHARFYSGTRRGSEGLSARLNWNIKSMRFSDHVLSVFWLFVCLSLNCWNFQFFFRTTGSNSTKLDTMNPWLKEIWFKKNKIRPIYRPSSKGR